MSGIFDHEPVRCIQSSDATSQHQVEDEMLRKLMNKSCKIYDQLQEEKRKTDDAKLRVCLTPHVLITICNN